MVRATCRASSCVCGVVFLVLVLSWKGWALTARAWLLFLRIGTVTFSLLYIMGAPSFVKSYYHFGSVCACISVLWLTEQTHRAQGLKAACTLFNNVSAIKLCCRYTLPTATDGVWTTYCKTPLATVSKLIIKWKKEIDTHTCTHTYTHIKVLHTTFKQTARHTQAVISAS